MSRYFFRLGLLVCGVLLILGACAQPGAVKTYTTHVAAIGELVAENKQNTDLAGEEILAYVKEHQQEIESALAELEGLSPEQVDKYYAKVMEPVLALQEALQAEPLMYPDSIRDQILAVLEENEELLAQGAEAAAAEAKANVIQQNFALFTVELGAIKEMLKGAPLKNFHLSRNPNFQAAAGILKIDNLFTQP